MPALANAERRAFLRAARQEASSTDARLRDAVAGLRLTLGGPTTVPWRSSTVEADLCELQEQLQILNLVFTLGSVLGVIVAGRVAG
ncbi:MAG: hypothetical protein R3C14_43445 [Caldilineaceae bacterium]